MEASAHAPSEAVEANANPVPALIATAPLLAVFLVSVAVVGGWLVGASPFWPTPEITLSEAAATRDHGEVVRLIEVEHKDPNRAWPVRSGITNTPEMTPLEAAISIRRLRMVELLLRHGAVVPPGEGREKLICQAVAAEASDIVEFLLKAGGGGDPRASCPPAAAP